MEKREQVSLELKMTATPGGRRVKGQPTRVRRRVQDRGKQHRRVKTGCAGIGRRISVPGISSRPQNVAEVLNSIVSSTPNLECPAWIVEDYGEETSGLQWPATDLVRKPTRGPVSSAAPSSSKATRWTLVSSSRTLG